MSDLLGSMLVHSQRLPLGWIAPDFSLPGADGQTYALGTFDSFIGLLVVFTCNHCLQAQQAWPDLQKLFEKYGESLAVVAINSDDASQIALDGSLQMAGVIAKYNLGFPYLWDEKQTVAAAYGVQCLPEPFLFRNIGGDRHSLFYHGRFGHHDLASAVERLITNQDPPTNQYSALGCAVNWKVASPTLTSNGQ